MKNDIENELYKEEALNDETHLRGPEEEDEDDLDLGDADGSGGELEDDDLGA